MCVSEANAQYYDWGPSPASVKWRTIETPHIKLIYPRDFDENARRTMWYLDTVRTHMDFGFRHPAMRTPIILHTQNTRGNGMVMWAPKRIEMLAAPAASYSEPWLKQLAIHEYRHNVQYNNLRRGLTRPLMWLLGEQIAFLPVGQFSIYILEGDATMAETEFSAFGRGLQPSWTMHYRAVSGNASLTEHRRSPQAGEVSREGNNAHSDDGNASLTGHRRSPQAGEVSREGNNAHSDDGRLRRKGRQNGAVGSDAYSSDYWFSGSFRDYVPDHYRLGYQMVRWSYDRFDKFIWDDVARYVARNPQFIAPMSFGLKRLYGLDQTELFRRSFADLNAYWASLPRVEDSSERIATPENSYTTYQWPLWHDDGTLVAFKSDMKSSSRIVRVDAQTGEEEVLAWTGAVSSRPVLAGNVLWWTEFRRSVLWDEKVGSRLCSYDLATGSKQTHRIDAPVFYPAPLPGGGMAYVIYDYSGKFSIVRGGDWLDLPLDVEVCGLAWDDATDALYFIGLDDGGMFLARANGDSYERITPSRHITISDLRAAGGKLYFGSIVSGKDEAHCYDLATGTEYRLSGSAYGSFQPSTPTADGGKIALTTYDRHGYHLAVQHTSGAAVQEQRTLPVDLVNPPWKRWDVPKMDSLVYTPEDAALSVSKHRSRRFGKLLNIFRPHSWVPADFYPPDAISESDLTMNFGATIISQSLLSDAVSWLAYGWKGREGGSMVRGGLTYRGLGPVFDLDFSWGGAPQIAYTRIPASLGVESKKQVSFRGRVSLPMSVSSGAWVSSLTPSAEYGYNNGLIFKRLNEDTGELTRGVEQLSLGLGYSGQTRMAPSEFLPHWGFTARIAHTSNPTNGDFRSLWSASMGAWLPGIVRPHSLRLRGAWQMAGDKEGALFSFRMKEVFPRGARYEFSPRRWKSGSIDYQFPLWYPEGGIPTILYFKRVRINLFFDYALWQDFGGTTPAGPEGGAPAIVRQPSWHRLYSWGGDVILDVSPMRLPGTDNFSAIFTFARPSDRQGVFFSFGLEMPL